VLEEKYEAALAAFKAIGREEHPDVANYIGFASRKLGRYDEAKIWYERALAADPTHVRTWQYYGMWHLEQGNRLKAEDYLARIALICGGTDCKEYKDLKGALDGTVSY
jgi:tetratricopeptide (TPR) repeat protein